MRIICKLAFLLLLLGGSCFQARADLCASLTDSLMISSGSGPDMATDQFGYTHVVWQDPTLGIMYAQVGPGGTVTVAATSVYPVGGYGFPHVAVDNAGNAHIIATIPSFDGLIYIKVSGGKQVALNAFFMDPTYADDESDLNPAIAINPVTQLPVVAAAVYTDYTVYFPYYATVYSTFVASLSLDASGNPVPASIFDEWYDLNTATYQFNAVSYPSVAVDNNGTTHVVWEYQDPDLSGLTVAYANSVQTVYYEIADNPTVNGLEGRPIIIRGGDGNLDVVWSTTDSKVIWEQLNPQGAALVHNAVVSQPEAVPRWPGLASASGQLICSWTDGRGGANSQIYARSLLDSAPECDVSQSPGAANNGVVGINSSGAPLYVWQDQRSGSAQLYYRASATTLVPLRITTNQAPADLTPENSNDPITPTTSATLLTSPQFRSPLGRGVVADGVTPVLFMISGPPGNYVLNLSTLDASSSANVIYSNGSLASNLFVLTGDEWVQSTNLTISSSTAGLSGTNFAYLQGINWSNLSPVTPPANQVNATLSLTTNGQEIATTHFGIRPPPILLVHGIASTATSWSAAFTDALAQTVPADFIRPITYGAGLATGIPLADFLAAQASWPNCTSDLIKLAAEVDQDLHAAESNLRNQWDFARYDAVGHSQGGVLLRMLCQTDATHSYGPFASDKAPVVSKQNFGRGRFRRVVTIGSPQNGSLLCYYLDHVVLKQPLINREQVLIDLASEIVYFCFPAIQKFDPVGWQTKRINSPASPVDPRIRFHAIVASIDGGQPPNPGPGNPPAYTGLALSTVLTSGPKAGYTRGQVLLPKGSDGVVDCLSQGGGIGTPQDNGIPPAFLRDVSHCTPESVFGVPSQNTETAFAVVGNDVANLLSGPDSFFGPFVLPQPLSDDDLSSYSAIIPTLQTIVGAIVGISAHIPSTNITYHLMPPQNLPLLGTVNWVALNYGTNGITTDGISVDVSTNDSTQMTLSVRSNVVGQVVVSAEYVDTNGDLVFAAPIVALSAPTSPGAVLTNIVLEPSSLSLGSGDVVPLQMVAESSDGTRLYLYAIPGQAVYRSSNPLAATVDTNGVVTMVSPGLATIEVSYEGLTAQCQMSSLLPAILEEPLSVVSSLGSNVVFSVGVGGAVPLSYQWNFNGTDLTDGAGASGTQRSSLTISNVQVENLGFYSVVVSNVYGSATSNPAFLSITQQSPPVIGSVTQTSSSFSFSWSPAPGSTYQVQFTTNIESGIWLPLGSLMTASDSVMSVSEPIGSNSEQFYRLVVVP